MKREARLGRDVAMATEWISGSTQAEIAKRHGTCDRTVRRAIARVKGKGPNKRTELDPLGALARRWAQLDAAVEELGLMRHAAAADRDRLRAIQLQMPLMREQMTLLADLGALAGVHETGHS